MRTRIVALLAWLALVLLAGWQVTQTRFNADLSAFLPSGDDARFSTLTDQIRSGTPARTLLIGIDGGDAAQRAAASRALAAALRGSGLFDQVNNGETAAWADIGRWINERRYLLSPAVDADRFTVDGLRAAITDTVSLLGTPAGALVEPLLESDPTGEVQRIAETLLPAAGPRTEHGVWMSRDGTRALLMTTTRAPGADLDAQAAAIDQVRTAFAAQAAPGLTLRLSGAPLFGVDSRAGIEREVRWLSIVGTLLLSALLLVAFASARALLAAMLPVVSGVLAGIVAVGLVFGSVHGMTLGFGVTLIGEAVDYGIYYLIQSQTGRGWRGWLADSWPTVRLGLLTSVCGFAALVFSALPGLAQLGVFSISGLVTAALTTRFVLPALMPAGARGVGLRRQLGRGARAALRTLPRSRPLWLVLGVLALLAIVQRGDPWQTDLSSLSPVSPEALALDARLRADIGAGDGGLLVVVQGADAERTLQRVEAAAQRLAPLVDDGTLAGFDSVTRWLPSLRTQQQRLAALPDAATLRARLAQATRDGPLPAARLGPFVDAVDAARQRTPETVTSVRGTPVAPLVDALLLQRDGGGWSALLPLQAPAGAAIDDAAVQRALDGLADTQLLELGRALGGLYTRYLSEARTQALLGALGVVVLLVIWLRQPRRVLAVCRPLVLAVLLVLGAMAIARVPIGILHLVGLLLVVAVGSNYALFFDWLRASEATTAPVLAPDGTGQPSMLASRARTADAAVATADTGDDMLASLMLANLTTVLSFGLIALSALPALSAIGRVVAPGALLALVLAAAFARPRR